MQLACIETASSSTWETANKAVLIPIYLPYSFTVARMGIRNGGTVSGNFDLGIYDRVGNRLSSTGGVAQANINVTQSTILGSSVTLKPNVLYFLAAVFDNTTATASMCVTASVTLAQFGIMESASSYVLPSTLTPATSALKKVPYIMCSQRSVL